MPILPLKIKILWVLAKNCRKIKLKFSHSALFYMKTKIFLKCFVQDWSTSAIKWNWSNTTLINLLWNFGTDCEVRLCEVECCVIRLMWGVRLVDSLSTDVLRDRVGVVVKIEDMIIQSRLQCYGHVMHGDINSEICEFMEVEITGKRKKGQPRTFWEDSIKKDLEWYGLKREDAYNWKKWQKQIRAKITNPGQPE